MNKSDRRVVRGTPPKQRHSIHGYRPPNPHTPGKNPKAFIETRRTDSPDLYLGGNVHQYLIIERSRTAREIDMEELSSKGIRRCLSTSNMKSSGYYSDLPIPPKLDTSLSLFTRVHLPPVPDSENTCSPPEAYGNGIGVSRRDDKQFSMRLKKFSHSGYESDTISETTLNALRGPKDSCSEEFIWNEKTESRHRQKVISVGISSKVYCTTYEGKAAALKVAEREVRTGLTDNMVKWDLVGTLSDSPGARLQHEVEILRHLQHPNVISLHAYGHTSDNRWFMLTELLPKRTLSPKPQLFRAAKWRRWLFSSTRAGSRRAIERKMARIKPMDVAAKGVQLAQGLGYLHERALCRKMVIHGNICPDNIGIGADGRLKIIDFASCDVKPMSEDTPCQLQSEIGGNKRKMEEHENILSRPRCLPFSCGALRYMAPEVAIGQQPISPASDVYSVGLLLWSMISGVDPYDGITRSTFYNIVVHNGTRPSCKTSWPEPLTDVIRLCWSQDPEARPSISIVELALGNILSKIIR